MTRCFFNCCQEDLTKSSPCSSLVFIALTHPHFSFDLQVGQKQSALQTLHDTITNKRQQRNWTKALEQVSWKNHIVFLSPHTLPYPINSPYFAHLISTGHVKIHRSLRGNPPRKEVQRWSHQLPQHLPANQRPILGGGRPPPHRLCHLQGRGCSQGSSGHGTRH